MKISTEINSAARIVGEKRAIELYGKAGFECWDFSMFEMCKIDSKLKHIDTLGANLFLPHISKGNGFFVAKLKRVK